MAEPNESSESSDIETEDACPTKSHNWNPTGLLDQLAADPTNRQGLKIIREAIANSTSIHLTSKKAKRSPIAVLGPHHEWSGDGHDKLSAIGFPLWGVRDAAIAYIFLSLVEQLEGMPVQMTTDCGSETGRIFGIVNALWETFAPHLGEDAPPAHRFLRSVNNITIERGWLQLWLQWGDNVKIYWEAREGIYHPQDLKHFELVQWLWPKLINQELDELQDHLNNHRVRKDRTKISPSGMTPHITLSLYKEYNAEWMLQHVDRNVVQDLMEELGGADLVHFVSVGYAERAEVVYSGLGISKLSFHNVWEIFRAMLPLI
ncbi:hypothetical protein Clacol_000880 [Clathrus columnatus]|uniref:Uncharacterized protein n=1 Tax=Clathrus columnatus TaxID=1419009 RepID=A0AAV5A456_9AGAM|nr:hypothetical protein Clacol_000880 [Clathrus columnatus]